MAYQLNEINRAVREDPVAVPPQSLLHEFIG